jgi:hypothetical protein
LRRLVRRHAALQHVPELGEEQPPVKLGLAKHPPRLLARAEPDAAGLVRAVDLGDAAGDGGHLVFGHGGKATAAVRR